MPGGIQNNSAQNSRNFFVKCYCIKGDFSYYDYMMSSFMYTSIIHCRGIPKKLQKHLNIIVTANNIMTFSGYSTFQCLQIPPR